MSQDLPTTFQTHKLSAADLVNGSILSPLQAMVIQNQIALYAQDRLNLTLDPTNVSAFIQREAELKGQISALQFLLNVSNDVESSVQNPTVV